MKKALVLLILSISLVIGLAACDGPVEHTHQYGEWSTAKAPTSTQEGLSERVCACGEKETKTIAKLPAGYSVGLNYKLNEDGQSYSVAGIGDCKDRVLLITPVYDGLPVTAINRSAFAGRKNLSSVVIPDGVTSVGNYAFSGCISLTNIEIPDSVTSIGEGAFYGCTGFAKIVIPDSVTSIGNSAFNGCKYIRDVYISDLDAWYNISFGDQSSNPMCNGANLHLDGKFVTEVTVPDTVTTWGYTFTGCTSIVSVTIPDSVTCIEKDAFRGCTGLESLVIPNSVTTIAESVFYGCENLTDVVIPDSVTDIGDFAFYGCTELTGIVIPDSVTRIGQNAFRGCDSLVYNEYDNAYYLSSDLNPYLVLVKAKDTAITSCEINPNTKFMLDDAFAYCTSLASIVIPDSVTSIGYSTFWDCTGLTSVVIGDCVTSIGRWAFNDCTGLAGVVIPDSVTSIGDYAFADCDGLTDVYYIGTEEEWAEISINYYFNPSLEKATIHYSYVPEN